MNNPRGFSFNSKLIPEPQFKPLNEVLFRVKKLLPEYVFDTTYLEDNPYTFAEVKTLLDGITYLKTISNPLTCGLLFFLFGALQQFFYDGNKRTSRLVMMAFYSAMALMPSPLQPNSNKRLMKR